jgi:hypothetical protein
MPKSTQLGGFQRRRQLCGCRASLGSRVAFFGAGIARAGAHPQLGAPRDAGVQEAGRWARAGARPAPSNIGVQLSSRQTFMYTSNLNNSQVNSAESGSGGMASRS